MELKEAKLTDQEQCLQMIEDFYRLDAYPFNQHQASANFKEFLSNDQLGKFWLIQEGAEVIGYLILTYGYSFEYGGRDAFIDEFYLKETFRGKGIGTEVLTSLNLQVKKLRVRAIHLEVEKTNTAGNMLYKKTGFKGNNRSLLTKIIA